MTMVMVNRETFTPEMASEKAVAQAKGTNQLPSNPNYTEKAINKGKTKKRQVKNKAQNTKRRHRKG